MTKTHNQNTRALVSSLRSDLALLRAAAVQHIDGIVAKRSDLSPKDALMAELGASTNTAKAILHERGLVTSSGKRKRNGR